MEHGATTIPSVRKDPLERGAARSSGEYDRSAKARTWSGSKDVSNFIVMHAP